MGLLRKMTEANQRRYVESLGRSMAGEPDAPLMKQGAPKPADPRGGRISDVGERTAAGLACPKCGGTQFKAKRSAAGKTIGTAATLGVAGAFLAPKSRVKCITCGTEYRRG
jgi:hypothetical protein